MGKQEKPVEAQEAKSTGNTVESIEKQINDGIIMSSDVAKQAAENIAKKNKERRVDEMEACIMEHTFIEQYSLLLLRKDRRNAEASLAFLKGLNELKEKKLDTGVMTKIDYNKAVGQLTNEKRKAIREATDTFDELFQKLKQNYKDYYTYDWQALVTGRY